MLKTLGDCLFPCRRGGGFDTESEKLNRDRETGGGSRLNEPYNNCIHPGNEQIWSPTDVKLVYSARKKDSPIDIKFNSKDGTTNSLERKSYKISKGIN